MTLELLKLKPSHLNAAICAFMSTLGPGVLYWYHFHPLLFREFDNLRLIIMALVVTVPFLMLGILLVENLSDEFKKFGFKLENKDCAQKLETQGEYNAYVLSAGALVTGAALYFLLILAYVLDWKAGTFELIVFICAFLPFVFCAWIMGKEICHELGSIIRKLLGQKP